MDSFLTLFATSVVAIICVSGQSSKTEWTASELYNPQNNAMMCGFPTNRTSYICDPNGILLREDLIAVDWILGDAAKGGTRCPCSTYFCENGSGPKGYKIAVALVKRMKKYRVNGQMQSPEEMAVTFTGELKNRKWKMGACEENVIVFYSVGDKMMYIDPGRTAAVKLNPSIVNLLGKKVAGRLNNGDVVEALNVLIHDIKILLNCDLDNPYDCTIYEKGAASITTTSLVSSLMALVTSVMVYLMRD